MWISLFKAVIASSCAVTLSLITPRLAFANSPDYSYELLYYDNQFTGETLDIRFSAISPTGEVVFVTTTASGNFRVYRTSVGASPILVTEASSSPPSGDQRFYAHANVGINADGIVSVPFSFPEENDPDLYTDVGFALFDNDSNQIRIIRELLSSSGRLNSELQLAGRLANSNIFIEVDDGISEFNWDIAGHVNNPVQISEPDSAGEVMVAVMDDFGTASVQRRILLSRQLDNWLSFFNLGPSNGSGYSETTTPGFNNLGFASFSTQNAAGDINPDPKVYLIEEGGGYVVADTEGIFANFRQARNHLASGVSLNRCNRVSFLAELDDESQSIWVGDGSGNPPILAVDQDIEFNNGWSLYIPTLITDQTSLGANSMSDQGEIAVIAPGELRNESGELQGGGKALFVALPAAGVDPCNPIIPPPEDRIPGGFRFQLGLGCVGPPPGKTCWFDPPVSIGYRYEIDDASIGEFSSVVIPTPLPNGDRDFIVNVNGTSSPLPAGIAFHFSTVTDEPVREFTITDIDTEEVLDPDDPTAFVTGLSFSEDTEAGSVFTMKAISFDPAVIFDDGFEATGDAEPVSQ